MPRTKPRRITLRTLQRKDACRHGCEWFARHFPNGAALTPANLKKIRKMRSYYSDPDTIAAFVLSPRKYKMYSEAVYPYAYAEYRKQGWRILSDMLFPKAAR